MKCPNCGAVMREGMVQSGSYGLRAIPLTDWGPASGKASAFHRASSPSPANHRLFLRRLRMGGRRLHAKNKADGPFEP